MCCRALALRRSVSLLVAICIVYIRLLELYVSVFYSVERFLKCGNVVDFQVGKTSKCQTKMLMRSLWIQQAQCPDVHCKVNHF